MANPAVSGTNGNNASSGSEQRTVSKSVEALAQQYFATASSTQEPRYKLINFRSGLYCIPDTRIAIDEVFATALKIPANERAKTLVEVTKSQPFTGGTLSPEVRQFVDTLFKVALADKLKLPDWEQCATLATQALKIPEAGYRIVHELNRKIREVESRQANTVPAQYFLKVAELFRETGHNTEALDAARIAYRKDSLNGTARQLITDLEATEHVGTITAPRPAMDPRVLDPDNPNSPQARQVRIERARKLFQESPNDWSSAAEPLITILLERGETPDLVEARKLLKAAPESWPQIQVLEHSIKILQLQRQEATTHGHQVSIQRLTEEIDELQVPLLEQRIAANADADDARLALCTIALSKGERKRAISLLTDIPGRENKDPTISVILAGAFRDEGMLTQSLIVCNRRLAGKPIEDSAVRRDLEYQRLLTADALQQKSSTPKNQETALEYANNFVADYYDFGDALEILARLQRDGA